MPHYVAANTEKLLKGIHNPKIAVLGVTYKADVDDMRESPAMEIVQLLSDAGLPIVYSRSPCDDIGSKVCLCLGGYA